MHNFGTTHIELRLPAEIDEQADGIIKGDEHEDQLGECARTEEHLIIRHTIGGNVHPMANVGSWLEEVYEALDDFVIVPKQFHLLTFWKSDEDS